jgi:hypothetical protein
MTGERLTDADELLFRQVHPSWVREGRITRQAFQPTSKDELKLSVARSSVTDAKGAYEHHTLQLGLASMGSWAVSVGECRLQSLVVLEDPLTSPPHAFPDPAHAVVDFAGLSRGQRELKGAILVRAAEARGRLYPEDDDASR